MREMLILVLLALNICCFGFTVKLYWSYIRPVLSFLLISTQFSLIHLNTIDTFQEFKSYTEELD